VLVLEAPTPGITGHKHSADMLNTLLERPADGYRLSFHQPFNERGETGGKRKFNSQLHGLEINRNLWLTWGLKLGHKHKVPTSFI